MICSRWVRSLATVAKVKPSARRLAALAPSALWMPHGDARGGRRLPDGDERRLEPVGDRRVGRGGAADGDTEVGGADVHAVQALGGADLGHVGETVGRLDHGEDDGLRVRVGGVGADAQTRAHGAVGAAAQRRVADGGHRVGGVLGGVDERDDDTGRARVERAADGRRVVGLGTDETDGGAALGVDRGEGGEQTRVLDQAVLGVQRDIVVAEACDALGGDRGIEDGPVADELFTGAQSGGESGGSTGRVAGHEDPFGVGRVDRQGACGQRL